MSTPDKYDQDAERLLQIGSQPCDCIRQCGQYWEQRCDCHNHDDQSMAEGWCVLKNTAPAVAAALRAAGEENQQLRHQERSDATEIDRQVKLIAQLREQLDAAISERDILRREKETLRGELGRCKKCER